MKSVDNNGRSVFQVDEFMEPVDENALHLNSHARPLSTSPRSRSIGGLPSPGQPGQPRQVRPASEPASCPAHRPDKAPNWRTAAEDNAWAGVRPVVDDLLDEILRSALNSAGC